MRKVVRKQRGRNRAGKKRAYPLLKEMKPTSRSSAILQKGPQHLVSLDRKLTWKAHLKEVTETRSITAHAD